jgi:hypothetical protein
MTQLSIHHPLIQGLKISGLQNQKICVNILFVVENVLHWLYWYVIVVPRATADRLERRRLPHPSACPFCDQAQESITHLLLDCVLARTVWVACLRWWDREDRLPPRGISLADWLQSCHGRAANARDYWTGVALICWCLWRHRNDVVFEGATASPHTVICNIRREAEL